LDNSWLFFVVDGYLQIGKPIQDIEQRELQHLKGWLQKQTFAHQLTQDYYGEIVWYYFTRAYEYIRPKEVFSILDSFMISTLKPFFKAFFKR